MTDTISKLKEKQAAELAKAETEQAILSQLPDVGFAWSIHVADLYGRVASAKIGQPWGYGDKPRPTIETLLTIAKALPGVPMVKVSGTFCSFLAVEQLPHYEKGSKIDSEEAIAPWIVEGAGGAGAHNGAQCDVVWVAKLPAGLVEITFELPYLKPLHYHARRIDYMGGHRYADESIELDRNLLYSIFGPDESGPFAELAVRPVKWASGSQEYPSKITMYWTPLTDPCESTVTDFAAALIAATPKA